ncbi:Cell cycle checkpoint control protein RAD9A, partial [Eschrichtius robustus]|nr:Cell cycle checkpoint control protein RAD9A [Eschrichtius robustus]
MKCLVTGSNVKVLGKAVHSLSRIGDELYLEPLEDGLSFRTVNSSRSAYACFLFAPLFFQQYQAATPGQDPLRCKILMKSFLSVFRSLAMLEKTVEKCCISLNGRSSRLVVQLYCKYGVRKTHNLSFQDCESLQAVFDPAVCPHVLRAPASTPHLDDFALDDIDSYMIAMETTVGSEGSRTLPSTSLSPGLQPPCSPGSHSEEEDDTEPSTVPGTPPPKKFRSLFFGSILAPAHSPQGPSPVLAEDSEGEG